LTTQTQAAYHRSVARLGLQAAEALAYAHGQKVLHRDIKPANLLLDLHGTLWVSDFGLAKEDGDELTRTGDVVGTLRYMAPERFNGVSDPRSDIYSLGLTLYELLTLRPAFEESDRGRLIRQITQEEPPAPHKLDGRVPRDLETIVLKASAKEPDRRYQMAEDLRRFLADRPILARRSPAWERTWRWCRRNPALAGLMAALALTLLAGFATVTWKWREAEQAREDERLARGEADERARENQQGLEHLKAANALLERGRWYISERRWDDAHAAFTEALRLRQDHASALDERSDLYARLGLWDLVAADIARGLEIREPDTPWRWARHAQLRIYVGDREGYRLTCRRMRERFRGTLNNFFVIEVVRTCVLAPDPDIDLAGLVELSELVADQPHPFVYSLFVLGTAHYRTGKYEQAVRRLRQALEADPEWARKFATYPVLAMACHRLGQQAEARKALDEAARALEQWTQERYQNQGGYWVFDRGATGTWPLLWSDWVEYELYYREARVLIDGVPPADDPRLHVLRARSFAGLRQSDKAVAEYAAALKMWPKDPQVRLEAHRNQAFYHIGRGQWSQAAAEFARACELRPGDTILGCYSALARFVAGEVDTYRKDCAALMERFAKTEHPHVACDVLLACVLKGDALPDRARLLPLARVAARHFHYGSWTRGAALYRAGKYDEAVQCFETAAKTYRPRAWEWCFLAMAHHRLGHAGEARRCLAEAARWIDEANRGKEDDPSGLRPTWGSWWEPAVYPLLLREAEELLKVGRSSADR
jgi:tetratricopeptide (TPR) repeat protein